jgi:hypothetical protein
VNDEGDCGDDIKLDEAESEGGSDGSAKNARKEKKNGTKPLKTNGAR